MAIYNSNMADSKNEDFAMFGFSFYFDKVGALTKITNNSIFLPGFGMQDIKLDTTWLHEIEPFVTISTPGEIEIDSQEHKVNSYYLVFFNFLEFPSSTVSTISVSKKKQLSILDNSSLMNAGQLTRSIEASDLYANLTKGKYAVSIQRDSTVLKLTHFHDHDARKDITIATSQNKIVTIHKSN